MTMAAKRFVQKVLVELEDAENGYVLRVTEYDITRDMHSTVKTYAAHDAEEVANIVRDDILSMLGWQE